MLTEWLIPITDPPRGVRTVRVCHECERADPFVRGVTNADAGIHATPTTRWTRTEIEACDHPDHERPGNAAAGTEKRQAGPAPRRRGAGAEAHDAPLDSAT